MDDAFRSRLHLTLYYPKLNRSQTKKIWKNNFQRLAEINELRRNSHQQPIDVDEKKIIKWVERNWETLQWNGRQIRNAFQTGVALAEFDTKMNRTRNKSAAQVEETPKQPILSVKTFKAIANTTLQFNQYLQMTHGQDEDAIAGAEKVRAATFDSPPVYKGGAGSRRRTRVHPPQTPAQVPARSLRPTLMAARRATLRARVAPGTTCLRMTGRGMGRGRGRGRRASRAARGRNPRGEKRGRGLKSRGERSGGTNEIALAWMIGTDGTLAVFFWSFPTLIIFWFLYLFGPYAV